MKQRPRKIEYRKLMFKFQRACMFKNWKRNLCTILGHSLEIDKEEGRVIFFVTFPMMTYLQSEFWGYAHVILEHSPLCG